MSLLDGTRPPLPHPIAILSRFPKITLREGTCFMLWPIFWSGAFGGIAPSVARLAGWCTAVPTIESIPSFTSMLFVCCGTLLFAGLGGGVACALPKTSRRDAFFIGIAAPALIGNFVSAVQDAKLPNVPLPHRVEAPFNFISSAHAGDVKRADEDKRIRELQQKIDAILNDSASIRLGVGTSKISIVAQNEKATTFVAHVCYMSQNDVAKFKESLKGKDTPEVTCLDQEFIQPKQDSFTSLLVPVGAAAVMLNGELFALNKPDLTIGISVDTGPTLKGDLLWALGGRRTETVKDIRTKELSK